MYIYIYIYIYTYMCMYIYTHIHHVFRQQIVHHSASALLESGVCCIGVSSDILPPGDASSIHLLRQLSRVGFPNWHDDDAAAIFKNLKRRERKVDLLTCCALEHQRPQILKYIESCYSSDMFNSREVMWGSQHLNMFMLPTGYWTRSEELGENQGQSCF